MSNHPLMITKDYLRETVAAKALRAIENMADIPTALTDSTTFQLEITLTYSTKGDSETAKVARTMRELRDEIQSQKETIYYLRRELNELQS